MGLVGGKGSHYSRCTRFDDIDWDEPLSGGPESAPVEPGDVVLKIDDLSKHYEIEHSALFFGGEGHTVKANENLHFEAREAETIAIVGESGCGKSTFAKVLMGLEEATEGEVRLGNVELGQMPVEERSDKIISRLQMVFQNPFDTLNPSQTVGAQIARVIKKFGVESDPVKIQNRVLELLDIVKLPRDFYKRRPRQLSGGQKQRVGIARAFAGNPNVVIADEPVSALDVSVQAAVTDLLMDIQRENRTTLLFISHDLSVVRYLADRIVVMYLGRIMEQGRTEDIFSPPYHPYTEALLAAVPVADTSVTKRKVVLTGEIPSPSNPPKGCPFSTRCAYMMDGVCNVDLPPLRFFGDGHEILCHLDEKTLSGMEPVLKIPSKSKGKSAGKGKTAKAKSKPKAKAKSKSPSGDAVAKAAKKTAASKAPAKKAAAKKPAAKKASKSKALSADQVAEKLAALPKDASPMERANAVGKRPKGITSPRKGQADDLKRVRGIGPINEQKLNDLGIFHFDQIGKWGAAEANWAGAYMAFPGRIEREDWIGQAAKLAKGDETAFSKRVDKGLVPSSQKKGRRG